MNEHSRSGPDAPCIRVTGARENNLRNVSLEIPHYQLIAVTGVSGSGKSSLAFDTIAMEGRRLYLESIPSFARRFAGRVNRPAADGLSGLFPVITISQRTSGYSSRSTAGTLSELYDLLRLLFARFGRSDGNAALSRSLFSFNSPLGACPRCRGLGVEDRISLEKLVADPALTLRQGALAPTLPNGYVMYSQVTVDALDEVCRAHGFSVDIPWNELSEDQRRVVLRGSDRIRVLHGKHSLESRLKWTGLKAKPREMQYYKGMLAVMEDILRRDRNRNILRYAESVRCSECGGARLNTEALRVTWHGRTIAGLADMELRELREFLQACPDPGPAEAAIIARICAQAGRLESLGLGHLSLSRPASTLTNGEIQRIRLVNQLGSALSNVLYVFDEPSIGLHPRDTLRLTEMLRELVRGGNTVIIIEHDPDIIRQADWVIETGPGAGDEGGDILFNGPAADFLRPPRGAAPTPTRAALTAVPAAAPERNGDLFWLKDCRVNNLKGCDAAFMTGALNVVTGVSGAGKASLVYGCLLPALGDAVRVDQSPIGRTPRSNPATYVGLADNIRDRFAALPEAKKRGYTRSRFSFNNRGGRCDTCEGAGRIQIRMHYIGQVDVRCPECDGRRFNAGTLEVLLRGLSIADVYDLSIDGAAAFFSDDAPVMRYLTVMQSLDLGYLRLGQPSTTLSGGEAQRIKLAASLVKKKRRGTWYILDEPTTGLHYRDTEFLVRALRDLTDGGSTIVCIEHQKQLIEAADHIIDMGPESGQAGGRVVYQGSARRFPGWRGSVTARSLQAVPRFSAEPAAIPDTIQIERAVTNNLKGVSVSFPRNMITVLTGLSGSGKSSLAFDTLFAESQSRFAESLSAYARTFIRQANPAEADAFTGLTPVIAVDRGSIPVTPRSTVGTLTGISESYRYLYSRAAGLQGKRMNASAFSFNHEAGACPACSGLGSGLVADPAKVAPDRTLSFAEGAFTHNPVIRYYGDPDSQFSAVLKAAAAHAGVDLGLPLKDLDRAALELVFYGTGDRVWETDWHYKTRSGTGIKRISMPWKGFCTLLNEEYLRRLHNKRLETLTAMLHERECGVCRGARLNPEALSIAIQGKTIHDLSSLSIRDTVAWFDAFRGEGPAGRLVRTVYDHIRPLLGTLLSLGLGHLSLTRGAATLSGGEGQRLRLAGQLHSGLTGLTYVLDEPTIGLHPLNVSSLLGIIDALKRNGNTVVIVEHDEQVIRHADYIIEMGPGSGSGGGRIVADGSVAEFRKNRKALTPRYLGKTALPEPAGHTLVPGAFGLRGVSKHTLVERDFDFSAGGLIAVTGVSGAGKSTLVRHVLAPTLQQRQPVSCRDYYDHVSFDSVLFIDQRQTGGPGGRAVAEESGLLPLLQTVFWEAVRPAHPEVTKADCSYTSAGGRCSLCGGAGRITVSMDFMDDVDNICDACGGSRYRPGIAALTADGWSLPRLMTTPLAETAPFFRDRPRSRAAGEALARIRTCTELGLGHLPPGQAITTLSGGERQRLRLAVHLLRQRGERTLFLLDEPTAGLHYRDIDHLIAVFNRLATAGHTILFIEHNRYLIAAANEEVCL
ncbi:AAA family ATPase [bacterium]|nr:AAA family ATPase [bacterium]